MITADEIRKRYVEFFLERQHRLVSSAPLVPPDDPTLLFTTAGMVQFKANYSGGVPLQYTRAVTVQKCLRAGGKGSDLENVGRTLRHHTFFEMLGNFSFGDYFKREAITWGWEFLTGPKWLGLAPERIWATVYGKKDASGKWDVDHEAEAIWKNETGVVNPIIRLDEKENFWGPAGGTGACGPCSEIKFFMGTEEQLREYQARAATTDEAEFEKFAQETVDKGDLFLEIWNLVFPQFDHQPDGSRPPLKNRGIDTGAGLERMTTACQMYQTGGRVNSPYETDLLQPLIARVAEAAGLPYPKLVGGEEASAALTAKGLNPAEVRLAMNACADHARTLTFALSEGIVPSNEGRGYVIRRILRRAARFGRKIGIREPFLHSMVDTVVSIMGGTYPEITKHVDAVRRTIRAEEERFSRTLHMGSEMLDEITAGRAAGAAVTGEEIFRLYDTYGFPVDLTAEIAEERGLRADIDAYEKLLAASKKKARASWKGAGDADLAHQLKDLKEAGRKTEFAGYDSTENEAEVIAILRGGARVDSLQEGQDAVIVLDRTPFYGEGGGQTGDRGRLLSADGIELFRVDDTQKSDEGFHYHIGQAAAPLETGRGLTARVDADRRAATMRNHSVTHLLQGVLKRVIGGHVTQSGSWVGPDSMRFDFTNPEAIPAERLGEIERIVNEQVRLNLPVTAEEMGLEDAKKTGAIAPFGEKYGARVRVVRMGEFSTEFCGGTHVRATGEIGAFIITGESSVASGIRRIEARAGGPAADTISRERALLQRLCHGVGTRAEELESRVAAMQEELRELRRAVEREREKQMQSRTGDLPEETLGDVTVSVAWIGEADAKQLRAIADRIRDKHGNANTVALLGGESEGKAVLIATATDDQKGTPFEAGRLVKEVAPLFDGRGGGKPANAQAGGPDPARLKGVIESGELMDRVKGLVGAGA